MCATDQGQVHGCRQYSYILPGTESGKESFSMYTAPVWDGENILETVDTAAQDCECI